MSFQNSHYCRREDVAKTRLEYCDQDNATREMSARGVEGHVSALGLCLKVSKIEVFLGIRAKGLLSRAARGDSSKKAGIHSAFVGVYPDILPACGLYSRVSIG